MAKPKVVLWRPMYDQIGHRLVAEAGAGIDVTYPEPLPPSHPLFAQENVIFTPHTAGLTTSTAMAQTRFAVEQVMCVMGGGEPTFPLNREAWEGKASRQPK